MTSFDQMGEVGSLTDDDDAFPGRDMQFEQGSPSANARRDWANDAAFENALRGHLLLEVEVEPAPGGGYSVVTRRRRSRDEAGHTLNREWFVSFLEADAHRAELEAACARS